MKGFIVYPTYTNTEGKTQIQLFGKLENGQSFVSVSEFTPYFFIKEKEEKKIKKLLKNFKTEKTNLTNFKGEKVIKISSENQTELNNLYNSIRKKIETYEADIKPHFRFMMDNDILGTLEIEGDYEPSEKIDRVYYNPKISPTNYKPDLKIASIDVESDSEGNLFCIGIHSDNYKENFFVTNKKLQNTISCKSEAECLEKFKSALMKLDPDIITGWNLIDFDLVYLRELFNKHKIPFDLGRDNSESRLRIEANFLRPSSAIFVGRQVIDGLNFIRDPFIKEAPSIKNKKFDSYTLEDVSQAVLEEGKLLKGKNRHKEIEELYKTNQQKLVDYNLQDCKLAYDILKKADTINLAVERSQLTGMPIDRITASIASFDSLYIRESRKKGLVSPTLKFSAKEERITGGYVQETKSGIYHNILVLDFKSLYPSILKTFNIDPASRLDKKEKNSIETPNKAYFKNQDGILPEIIEKLHQAREKAKRERRELSSYAIKTIMNSFWGVLASPNCRYFNMEMANSITGFAREIIKLTAKEIEKLGYKTIYSDTDSVFVQSNLQKKEANELAEKIQKHINKFYEKYVKEEYNRKSYLELEFEKQYLSLIIPKIRDEKSTQGAKKRYAGLKEVNGKEEIEIVGLEAIRGDWTDAAQDFQKKLLDKVFHKKPINEFIKSYVKDLQKGKLDEKLIYTKSIRKKLEEYTKTTPPHVKAARKLEHLDSNIIKYYITTDGPEPVEKLQHKIDYKHYIDKQIKPIANQILDLLGESFDDVIQNSKQSTLF